MLPRASNTIPGATSFPYRQDIANQPPVQAFMPLPEVAKKEEHAVTIRPAASAHMMIDSLDRYGDQYAALARVAPIPQSTPGNNFKIQSQEALIYGYFTRLAITQVYLKYNVPTVVAQDLSNGIVGNNQFAIQEVGQAVNTLTIPQGFYTAQSLTSTLNGLLAASPAPYNAYTCVWDSIAHAFRIASNTANTFFVTPVIFASATSAATSRPARTQYLLGVSSSNIGPANAATFQVFGPPRLYYTSFVDIVSERLTKFQRVKDSESSAGLNRQNQAAYPAIQNIVARVYLTPPNQRLASDISGSPAPGSSPCDIVVDYNTPKQIRWSGEETVYELDFRLFDQFGTPLYWTPKNATEFCLTMVASES